jgi:diketogulonate reductase-like aldo/keto reductase
LLHWPGRHALSDTIAAFEELESAGKIRSWGVSNFDETELDQALSIAGPGRIACNQVLYHLGERSIEHAVLPWCEANGVALVGYTPFGRAKFPPSGSGGDALARIAKARGKTVRQVALAFLTRKPNLFAIPKASKPEHVRDNAGALGLELSPEEIAAIDAGFPMSKKRRGVPML